MTPPPIDRPAAVASWSPAVLRAEAVAPSERLARFVARASDGYRAAPSRSGRRPSCWWAVATSRWWRGTAGWSRRRTTRCPASVGATCSRRSRVSGRWTGPPWRRRGTGHANYFHWLTETVATAAAQAALGETGSLLVPGPLRPWQQDVLEALAPAAAVVKVAADEAVLLDAGRLSSLIGPEPGFAPHPGLLALLAERAAPCGALAAPALYLARLDAGDRRRMENEEELCAALAGLGCDIVLMGGLPFAEQVRRVRGAGVVVAPHGAALATLACAPAGAAGPAVIELFAEDYLNRCFTKLAQAKGLRYQALVHPLVRAGPHHHDTVWRADIGLVVAAVARRLGRT